MSNSEYFKVRKKTPIKIHNHTANTKPLVTIACITFNHENYIKDTLDGFLMQNTSFPVEIIVHDDASSDNTSKIIKDYEVNYPNLFRNIYQKENQYSKGKSMFAGFVFPKARGKYIALCEGDDYWTDPLKLQKQVKFMEENEDCSLCFHAAEHVYENEEKKNFVIRPDDIPPNSKFTIEDAILGGGGFMTTNTMLFKTEYTKNLPEWVLTAPVGDIPLMLWLGMHGKLGYIDDNMSAYRISTNGSWSQRISDSWENRKKHYKRIQKMWSIFDEVTEYKYHNAISQKNKINRIKHYKRYIKKWLRSIY